MKVLAINDIEYLQMSKIVYFIEAFWILAYNALGYIEINSIYEKNIKMKRGKKNIQIMHKNMTTATKQSVDRNSNFCLDDKN